MHRLTQFSFKLKSLHIDCVYPWIYNPNQSLCYHKKGGDLKLRKVGNSLVVAIPKDIISELQIPQGTDLTFSLNKEGQIILTPESCAFEDTPLNDMTYNELFQELADILLTLPNSPATQRMKDILLYVSAKQVAKT